MTTAAPADHGAAAGDAPRWLHHAASAIALTLAAVHTTIAVLQQSMNEDGISYLDLGDAWLDGDWRAAINGIWSPAYAWLVAAAVRLVHPSATWEFPTVQLVNFLVYAVALLAFRYFWRRLTIVYYGGAGDAAVRFPPAGWLVLGYSLFIWASLDLIEIWAVTPDMAVAAVVYLTAGFMLRMHDEPAGIRSIIPPGLLLGFGFLVKAALLPLGLAALALAASASEGPVRARAGRFLAGVFAMLVVAGPLIGALSWSAGHPTIGDVGRFAYLKHVNEMPYPDFHDALDRLGGTPAHAPRQAYDEPPVYAFGEPVAGTYPMAYDPGYWTEGLEPVITVRGQARALITSGITWFALFVREQGGFLAVVLLLGFMCSRRWALPWPLGPGTVLVLWSLAAFGLYSLVYVESRYIAPFVVLFWSGLLVGLRLPDGTSARRLAAGGIALLSVFVWVNLGALHLDGLRRVTGFTPLDESATAGADHRSDHSADHPAIAAELMRLGLGDGDRVGVIGYAYSAYWARLARLKIVAEIHWHDQSRFWEARAAAQAGALDAFARAGARAVVAEPVPGLLPPGWSRLGDTGYLVRSLRD